ncbi:MULTISPECIES: RNA-binding S4 domain-containing protein [Mesorhizobium]|jgi:ribosome-associated heat shock protein Hsp15|uniref:RNA-binding protein n=1 Tax=Rhizobium loti TaxID=381 RepID=A0A6M7TWH9_RHILI|nr:MULTISPECIES: RNA-binding S4 domain-containing protein [Mesorhizobium]KRB21130.1 RNA-binding protein [Mesorhizobium sp. Root172]OBQ65830.1 RNA-binding protein [Mesorhizobium loti]QKC68960.1 RNA-binding S4 domain-containing protein [Mesorhizobium loti]QKC88270.1 RNA-binding S4 domain-containing protein [Mesorhizobium sp. NZP2234]
MVAEGRQRIDKWLFFSRAVKSRSLAAKLVVAGRVRINRDKAAQASDLVKPGDVLTITLDRRIFVWKVIGAGVRRGPAEEARTLYEDMSPPPAPKGEALPDAIPALREAGSGRPTKKERRQTDRLLGEE